MANISIYGSINVITSIQQKPARFNFPVSFLLKFYIENVNIKYSESASLTSNVRINGTIKLITPISGNSLSSTNVKGQVKNSLGISCGLMSVTTINSNILRACNMDADIISNSTINIQISKRQLIVPQTINPTADIVGEPTAILKLITNIIANTSIAISIQNNINLDSNLSVNGDIEGDSINLIKSDVIQNADIVILERMNFPLKLPLEFDDNQAFNITLDSDVTLSSIIMNTAITDLINVNLESDTTLNATLACIYKIGSIATIISSISSTISQNIGLLLEDIRIKSTINPTISDKSNLIGQVIGSESIGGISSIKYSEDSNAITNTNIEGETQNLISSILIQETLIELQGVIEFPLNFPVYFNDGINNNLGLDAQSINVHSSIINNGIQQLSTATLSSISKIQCLTDISFVESVRLNIETNLDGHLSTLITSDCNSVSDVYLKPLLNFPLTLPLLFNQGISNNIKLSSTELTSESLIINDGIKNLLKANVSILSDINGTTTNLISSNIDALGGIYEKGLLGFPLNFPLYLGIGLCSNLNLYPDNISANVVIDNNSIENLISSDLFSTTSIHCISIVDYDLTENLKGTVNLGGYICSLIESTCISTGEIKLNKKFRFPLTFPFYFKDGIEDFTLISGSLIAPSSIKGDLIKVNPLTATVKSNSSIIGTAKNNLQLVGNLISASAVNVKVSYSYSIIFKGIFIRNSKATLEFDSKKYTNSPYVNFVDIVTLGRNILKLTYMNSIKETEIFNTIKQLSVQTISINKTVITVSDMYETVIFSSNISNSSKILNNKERVQLANITNKTKF
ncbi:hypothetical protein D2A34_21955 [Clostridium chromiireducens]|uniref:Uncharacterized protein n=1 Tax=Clostridium chromiireducens TaxID=225345 RepID=A0A399IN39_9CLOT|nr:hypothetical protein [Clostridium chromiireducens]RII32862.1 hypothetical protein D2A34_21955 [Clostridium chromiireducens]